MDRSPGTRHVAVALSWLTHPVTVGAVVLLLVNDHLLKAAYPGPVTGKLSDIAGLGFTPALVATMPCLLVPRVPARRPPPPGWPAPRSRSSRWPRRRCRSSSPLAVLPVLTRRRRLAAAAAGLTVLGALGLMLGFTAETWIGTLVGAPIAVAGLVWCLATVAGDPGLRWWHPVGVACAAVATGIGIALAVAAAGAAVCAAVTLAARLRRPRPALGTCRSTPRHAPGQADPDVPDCQAAGSLL